MHPLKTGLAIISIGILQLIPMTSQAALIGATPTLPTIQFGGGGSISYDSTTSTLSLQGQASTLFSVSPFILSNITASGNNFNTQFSLNPDGTVNSANSTASDMTITGAIDTDGDNIADYSGTLLTGMVVDFGFQNGTANGDDLFDLRLNSIGGALAFLYQNNDLFITVASEASSAYPTPFNGSFNSSWKGHAKGTIGSTVAVPTLGNNVTVDSPSVLILLAGVLPFLFGHGFLRKNANT